MTKDLGWLNRKEYPFESKYLNMDGHTMHYIDEGEGSNWLFVHGTPSWSFEFRKQIDALSARSRCLAIDHLGFGLSDKPKDYPYSTRKHARNLERFVLEKDLKDITLVMHDFGGPIGMDFAVRHPERVAQFVFLNTWLWRSDSDPEFKKMSRFLRSPLMPFLYRNLNFSPRFLMPSSFGARKMDRNLHQHYLRPFSRKKYREGPLAFAHSLYRDQDYFGKLWKDKAAVNQKTTLIIWGMKDPVIKAPLLDKLAEGFPQSTVLRLEHAGHYPQEEYPQEVADAMVSFAQRNP